ncbi:sensor histidine kinase [Undibacterium crateris]|uniref:sensor histidine kinase n=1 Tax=Undibacterium crateris TaxID=2528175 RepID=UPI00138A556D|nr:ATP-binding protein [Undibacterium crateris]NDI86079.1 PAS domain-containing protein [Undibacterium crateris]
MQAPLPGFSDPSPSFWRSLQTFNISRIVIAACLLLLLNLRSTKDIWVFSQLFAKDICFAYLFASISFALIRFFHQRHFVAQLLLQIFVDLLVISLLYLGSGGGRGGLSILFMFPLAGVAILSPLIWAFFFCSIVSLFLLVEGVYRALELNDGNLVSQAGLFGASYFAVIYVVSRLANNLIRQEQLATQRGNELAMQQAINRLVIADMGDGILVLDHSGRVFEINPAAERMLGGNLSKEMLGIKLANIVALRPMAETLADMRQRSISELGRNPEDDISFVSIPCYQDEGRSGLKSGFEVSSFGLRAERPHFVTHLKLRFILVDDSYLLPLSTQQALDRRYTIVFMQDVSDIENQAQQLKLASMGRLTASIAHEVRNPLSSISYAASLLNEDLSQLLPENPQARRLLRIVDDNVARLNQLIEDILKLSRKARTDVAAYPLMRVVRECVQDFSETRSIDPELILISDEVDFQVSFDPGHLFEVLTNLLSNAVRYASGKPGSIRLHAMTSANGRQELHIQDDGPAISYDVRAHLFEPFYTTSRMGTGLGLYMARELCLNNRSLLDYEYRVDESLGEQLEPSGRFVINFSGLSV